MKSCITLKNGLPRCPHKMCYNGDLAISRNETIIADNTQGFL